MQQLWTGIVKLLFCVKTLTVNRDQQKSSWKHLIRFVCVLYFIVSQDYSFNVNMWLNWWRNKVRQRRARTCYYQVKQLIRQNIQFTFFFCSSSNHFLKRQREKSLKLFKNRFQKGVLFKSQIVFPKTSAGDLQIHEKKRKRNGIGCVQQTSKYLTDKISDQTVNSHVNIIF